MIRKRMAVVSPLFMLGLLPLAGCAASGAQTPPQAAEALSPAIPEAEQPRKVEIVRIPEPLPLPLPGQLKPIRTSVGLLETADPKVRIGSANAAARMQPARDGFLNAIQQYPWAEGALYQLYTAPGQVTDIALQEGEQLVGPVAAGDTVRWIMGDTLSGSGPAQRVHILVKPTRPGLSTNLVINTDRRTYHLELRSTPDTYMASVSWTYPQDALIALAARNREAAAPPPVPGVDLESLNFGYRIDGDRTAWRPVRAFDDGRQVFIELPTSIGQSELPPLFVAGAKGAGELVNYRMRGRYLIVDRLFGAAELRLGGGKSQKRVRVLREDALPGARAK